MRQFLRIVLLFVFAVAIGQQSSAQTAGRNAVGARFGSASGLNYRYMLNDNRAIEGIVSIQSSSTSNRFRLVGLYEYHRPFIGDLTWYYGFGGSIGSHKYKAFTDNTGYYHQSKSELALSIDGIIGLDYAIPSSPISLSLDLKPYFDFLQESSIRMFDPVGFSIRYRF